MARVTPTAPPLPNVPPGVTRTIKANRTYWYYDPARAKLPGKRRRLPNPGTLDWFDEIDGIRREQSGEPPALHDVRTLIEDYKQTVAWRQFADGTVESYSAALKPILSQWRYRRPGDITVADVVALMERLAGHPSSANMTLTLVRKLMTYAIQKGLRSDNPARDVAKLKEAKDSAQPLTPEAWSALMAPECPVAVYRLAILGRYTGQRISDVVGMRPIDREGDWLGCRIKKLKDKEHSCILTARQTREIDGWGATGALAYICKPDGKPYTTDGLRYVWNAYARTDAGKALAGFTPHDLRATKVCDERISGKTHQQIAAMVGMSVQKVMHYSKHIDQRLVARGAEAAKPPFASNVGPLGQIRDLTETAAYLKAPVDVVEAVSRQLRIGARFGEFVSFSDEDIRALWVHASCRPGP